MIEEPTPLIEPYGNAIMQSTYSGVSGQKWRVDSLSGADSGYYKICPYEISNKAIGIQTNSNDTEEDILRIFNWSNSNNNLKWKIEDAGDAPVPELNKSEIKYGEIYQDLPEFDNFSQNMPYETTPKIVLEEYIPYIYVKCDGNGSDKASKNPWYIFRLEQLWRMCAPIEIDGIGHFYKEISYNVGVSRGNLNALDSQYSNTKYTDFEATYLSIPVASVNSEIALNESQQTRTQTLSGEMTAADLNIKSRIEYSNGKKVSGRVYQLIDRYTILNKDRNPVCDLIEIQTDIITTKYCTEDVT